MFIYEDDEEETHLIYKFMIKHIMYSHFDTLAYVILSSYCIHTTLYNRDDPEVSFSKTKLRTCKRFILTRLHFFVIEEYSNS